MVKIYVIVQSAEAGDDGDMFHCVHAYSDREKRPKSTTGYIQNARGCFPASSAAVKQAFGANAELQVKYSSCHAGTPEDFKKGVEDAARRSLNNRDILKQSKGSMGLKVLGGAAGVAVICGAMLMQGVQCQEMAQAFSADGIWTDEEIVRFVYETATGILSPVTESLADIGRDAFDKNATSVLEDPTDITDPGIIEEVLGFVYEGAKEGFVALLGL
jgi:hypothetical protein